MPDDAARVLAPAAPRVSTRNPERRLTQDEWYRAFLNWKDQRQLAG